MDGPEKKGVFANRDGRRGEVPGLDADDGRPRSPSVRAAFEVARVLRRR